MLYFEGIGYKCIGESRWVVGCTINSRVESTLRYRGESGRLRRQEVFMGYNWLLNGEKTYLYIQ